MPGMMDNVKTLNSVLRTLIALVVVGAASVAAWFGISTYYAADWQRQATETKLSEAQAELEKKEQTIAEQLASLHEKDTLLAEKDGTIHELNTELVEKDKQIAALSLLKVQHRLADIKVVKIGKGEDDGQPFIDVTFQEIDDEHKPVGEAQKFHLIGNEIRVDTWQVDFDDKYIEQSDIDRSTSLCLFKRIYGEVEGPLRGYPIETIGSRPVAYGRGRPLSDFEQKIWSEFWLIANDRQRAEELGISGANGKSDFVTPDKAGRVYRFRLESDGGTFLGPVD